jgi:hypothetical protein
MHEVALLPGSDTTIFKTPQWLPIVHDQQSSELWANFWWPNVKELKKYLKSHTVKKLVFYDIFHAHPSLNTECIDLVKHYQELMPTVLLTACKTLIPGIRNVLHFDFYWNRAKFSYLDKTSSFKQQSPQNYNQWPIELAQRPGAVLSLYGQNNWGIKQHLYHSIKHVSGYHSGQTAETSLPSETGITDPTQLTATPPARKYFDNTYISAQVESLCYGPSVLYSEKTYDHLIQGRFVMNYGPKHFYRTLVNDGWKLPVGVDYNWDDIEDYAADPFEISDQPRFHAYIQRLLALSSDMEQLHNLFIANRDVFAHNHEQLRQKPYDIISLEQLAHKYT